MTFSQIFPALSNLDSFKEYWLGILSSATLSGYVRWVVLFLFFHH